MRFDGVMLGTDDLATATRDYQRMLGVEPAPTTLGACFRLSRGIVSLIGAPGAQMLAFDDPKSYNLLRVRGVLVSIGPHGEQPPAPADTPAIDHVVVHTTDPEHAIAHWRDHRGLRLALDREFPARNLRLLFFRSGGITLEYASPLPTVPDADGKDRIHGVSYRVTDLAPRRERLLAAGVDVSDMRPGMRPGTTVATVRSHTAGVRTLLLQVNP